MGIVTVTLGLIRTRVPEGSYKEITGSSRCDIESWVIAPYRWQIRGSGEVLESEFQPTRNIRTLILIRTHKNQRLIRFLRDQHLSLLFPDT